MSDFARQQAEFQRGILDGDETVLAEILDEHVATSRNRCNPRGVKRKMSNYPLRRGYKRSPPIDIVARIKIVR